MASTTGSPPRKRPSSEREPSRESRKRRKESGSSREEKSKHSKSSKSRSNSSSSKPGLKVRSVTELAALVASGAVRVPRGLQHYVSDRTQLLDQVFTILSPGDISGMLPDVLKGLKMRKVKQLCQTKLQGMSEEAILSTIQSDDPTLETNLNNTLMQLLGQPLPDPTQIETPKEDKNLEDSEKADKKCDNKEYVISISDVSEDECAGEKKISQDMEIDSTCEKPKDERPQNISPPRRDSETTQLSEDVSSDSEQECEDIPEAGQLLEMEMRRRALESALKKTHHPVNSEPIGPDATNTTTTVDILNAVPTYTPSIVSPDIAVKRATSEGVLEDKNVSKFVSSDLNHTSNDTLQTEDQPLGKDMVTLGDGGAGHLIELKLREKLLQSLAAKKK